MTGPRVTIAPAHMVLPWQERVGILEAENERLREKLRRLAEKTDNTFMFLHEDDRQAKAVREACRLANENANLREEIERLREGLRQIVNDAHGDTTTLRDTARHYLKNKND